MPGKVSRGKAAVNVMALQKLTADAAVAYINEVDNPAPDLLERNRLREVLRNNAMNYMQARNDYELTYGL